MYFEFGIKSPETCYYFPLGRLSIYDFLQRRPSIHTFLQERPSIYKFRIAAPRLGGTKTFLQHLGFWFKLPGDAFKTSLSKPLHSKRPDELRQDAPILGSRNRHLFVRHHVGNARFIVTVSRHIHCKKSKSHSTKPPCGIYRQNFTTSMMLILLECEVRNQISARRSTWFQISLIAKECFRETHGLRQCPTCHRTRNWTSTPVDTSRSNIPATPLPTALSL